MATMFDFNFLEENLLYLEVFGQEWIIPIVLTLLFMLIVTRDTNKFSILFLPMIIGVKLMGFYVPLVIYIPAVTFGGFLFVVSALGTDVVGTFISASAAAASKTAASATKQGRYKSQTSKRDLIENIDKLREYKDFNEKDLRMNERTMNRAIRSDKVSNFIADYNKKRDNAANILSGSFLKKEKPSLGFDGFFKNKKSSFKKDTTTFSENPDFTPDDRYKRAYNIMRQRLGRWQLTKLEKAQARNEAGLP